MKAFCLLLLLLVVAVRCMSISSIPRSNPFLADLVCNEGEFVITVQKIFVGDSKNEEYQIWDGEDPSSTMLFKRVNTRADSMKTVRDYVCLKEGDYSLRMFSRYGSPTLLQPLGMETVGAITPKTTPVSPSSTETSNSTRTECPSSTEVRTTP